MLYKHLIEGEIVIIPNSSLHLLSVKSASHKAVGGVEGKLAVSLKCLSNFRHDEDYLCEYPGTESKCSILRVYFSLNILS